MNSPFLKFLLISILLTIVADSAESAYDFTNYHARMNLIYGQEIEDFKNYIPDVYNLETRSIDAFASNVITSNLLLYPGKDLSQTKFTKS